jgi:hypothetical protein
MATPAAAHDVPQALLGAARRTTCGRKRERVRWRRKGGIRQRDTAVRQAWVVRRVRLLVLRVRVPQHAAVLTRPRMSLALRQSTRRANKSLPRQPVSATKVADATQRRRVQRRLSRLHQTSLGLTHQTVRLVSSVVQLVLPPLRWRPSVGCMKCRPPPATLHSVMRTPARRGQSGGVEEANLRKHSGSVCSEV